MASVLANNTVPVVTEAGDVTGGHRQEVIIANELGIPGGPVTVADGGDVTQGAVADAAVAAGAAGSISAKLRRATAQLAALGATTDAAEDDPSQTASLVALLKGLLTTANAILVILEDVHDDTANALRTVAAT